jgi:hypothetical protein
LNSVIDQFGTIHAPKHLVLVSAGLILDQSVIGRYQDLANKAARAHVSLFVVQLDQSAVDPSTRNGPHSYGGQIADGLGSIASTTGGQYFHGVGAAAGAFDRIAADINSFYELGVESLPQDADGKPHKVEVKVARSGVTVSAPAATAVPSRKPLPPADALKAALAEPTDVTQLPLEVATYVMHSDDPEKVKVIVSLGAADAAQPRPAVWGSVVLDGNSRVGAVGAAVEADGSSPWSTTGSLDVAPGRYRLRSAIVSGDRIGTLELPLAAGLRAMGGARASDLIVGVVEAGRLLPRARLSHSDRVHALIELSADRPLTDVGGYVIVTPAGSDTQVVRAPLTLRAGGKDKGIVFGEAALDLSSLGPGRYAASASIQQGGTPVGRVSRAFEIVP